MKASAQPSEVLVLRGLTAEITEKMIYEKIEELGFIPEYVRIPRDNSKKISKGLALIKFASLDHSTNFFNSNPVIEINDSSLWLEFGFEHSSEDWTCKSCRNKNFKNREHCFRCSQPKTDKSESAINDGRDDVSIQPTRFLLIRNLDENLTAQKIYDKIFLSESNLKRVWLLIDRETRESQKFAFLEFFSDQDAETFLSRQANLGVPLKIESNEIVLSYGRDLSLLSQSLSGAINGKISYWDNKMEFSEHPAYVMIVPEVTPKSANTQVLGIPAKRAAFGAFSIMSSAAGPSKKIQLQLKNWTEKAKVTDEIEESNASNNFVPEESLRKSKNKFIDTTFLCCLLCDMKFSSESSLMDHAQNSLDHAEKFEEYWRTSVVENQNESELYHDRAAERREAFGIDEEKLKNIKEEQCKPSAASPVEPQNIQSPPLVADSIGAKLLKKMGWKEGTGLGKNSSGIKEPIIAKTIEHSGAGIGATNLISADSIKQKSYNDKVRNDRPKRYAE